MYCYHCGKEIDDDQLFCPYCGKKVKRPASKQKAAKDVPAKAAPPKPAPTPDNNNKKIIIIVAVIAAALIAAAAIFFLGRGGDDGTATQPTQATETTGATEATESANPASAEATEFNGNYYEVINEGSTWSEAKVACEEMDGHLAIITSQDEEYFIENLIEENKSDSIYHYWLGASDEDAEGTWTWLDGQEFWQGGPAAKGGHSVDGMYNNWLPSQPNNSVKESDAGQDYLEIQVTRGNEGPDEYMTWTDITHNGVAYGYEGANDYNDTQFYGYICEWEGDE